MKPIPDWLSPYKADYVSQSFLLKNIASEPIAFSSWFMGVKQRVKQISEPCITKPGTIAKRYLVKSVWAMSQAHLLELRPANAITPVEEKLAALEENALFLERKVQQLTNALTNESKKSNVKTKVQMELLHRLVATSSPDQSEGVYFLINAQDEVVYVGQSKNVIARMSGHQSKDYKRIRVVRTFGEADRMRLEKELIGLLSPRLNVHHNENFPGSLPAHSSHNAQFSQ